MTMHEKAYNAMASGNIDVFCRVVDEHPQVIQGEDGIFLLHHAAGKGHLDIVRELIRRGVDINSSRDEDPEGAVVYAADSGNAQLVQWMIDNGAVFEHTVDGKVRSYALTGAIVEGHRDIVELLIQRGANVNADGGGMSPLGYAVTYKRSDIAELLRRHGAVQ